MSDSLENILDSLIYAIKNQWKSGEILRIETKFNEDKTKCELIVHNHIADFNSKYNLDGEFFHTSNQWYNARILDIDINKNLNRGCELINESSKGMFEATVLEPGNILEVFKNDWNAVSADTEDED